MQSIVSYQTQVELFQFSFIKGNLEIICPNPTLADDIRTRIPKSRRSEIQTLTIAKFMSDLIAELTPNLNILRKAELMLELSVVWKVKFNYLPASVFFNAFHLTTDLRSFTLDLALIEEILDEYDEDTSLVIRWFFSYIEQRNICDEHKAYRVVSENLRNSLGQFKFFENRQFLFLGFTHLSSGQINFIEALKDYGNIYIPIPCEILKNAKSSDWVKWIESGSQETIELKESDRKDRELTLNYALFPKGRMAETYFNLKEEGEKQIFLGLKDPGYAEVCELPEEKLFFKAPSEALSILESSLAKKLRNLLIDNTGKSFLTNDFIKIINDEMVLAINKENFRLVKILNDYKKTIIYWKELSETNEMIHDFDFQIIEKVVRLNLPRIYNIPRFQEKANGTVRGLEGLWSFNPNKKGILCITGNYPNFGEGLNRYNEKTIQLLSSLGPIRNQLLDFEFSKSQIIEYLALSNSTLLIEKGLIESNIPWNEIWRSFYKKRLIAAPVMNNNHFELPLKDPLANLIQVNKERMIRKNSSLNPSRLQLYLDCPRKFYFSILEPIPQLGKLPSTLNASELGEIEHRVVSEYLTKYKDNFLIEDHHKICKEVMNSFFLRHEKDIEDIYYKNYFLEVTSFTKRVIQELQKFYKIDKQIIFDFELNKKNGEFFGRIDCVLRSQKLGLGVLDFKRSSSSIPMKGEFERKEKIQLWFYLNLLSLEERKNSFWGYVSMSSLEDSLIYATNDDIKDVLEKSNFLECSKINILKEGLEEHLFDFNNLLNQSWKKLKKETNFLANPKNISVCQWCSVKTSCPKKSQKNDVAST